MDVRELQSPDDFLPTPSIRYRVLMIRRLFPVLQGKKGESMTASFEPSQDGRWTVSTREVGWDQTGSEVNLAEYQEKRLEPKAVDVTKQIWNSQGFSLVAHYHTDYLEVLYYENRADWQRLEAQTSLTLPPSLEVWICPTHDMTFKCAIPKTLAFSLRSADQLAQQGIAHTELHVTEWRGSLTAKVYWLNGQPSADAQTFWQPIIDRKVREYLQTSLSQSTHVFIKGILEDSVRQGTDARDLIVAGVDLQARLAQLHALDYQPISE
jgi:hypothetical protein